MQRFEFFKNILIRYERHLSSLALVAGFIFDNLTLNQVGLSFDTLVLSIYIALAAFGIVVVNLYEGGALVSRPFAAMYAWLPLVIQFAFGALFSGFFVFYSRSGSLSGSWPFLIVLLALLIGNEFFRKYYVRLSFQISLLFLSIFSFAIFIVPVVVKKIGPSVFVGSGVLSLVAIILFLYFLARFIPTRIRKSRNILSVCIIGIFAMMNVLYFGNVIPPIPLSLKEAGVYHTIRREAGQYILEHEKEKWYDSFRLYKQVHIISGSPLYLYSSVFAPTDISTDVVHEWNFRDPETGEWQTLSRIQFPIVGGRSTGYRGYSLKNNVMPGVWRVDVETPNGQLIGRVTFEVVEASPSFLETVVK